MSSHADAAFFVEHGYWIGPRVFSTEEANDALEAARRVCAGDYETGEAPQIVYEVTDPERGLRKFDNAWWADKVLESIVCSPGIGRLAAELIGVDEIYLWHDQLLWKPGGSDAHGHVGWHQDRGYWTASSTSEMLTAWVALTDVTEDMGALRFVDASHTWGPIIKGNAFFETDLDGQRRDAELPEGAHWSEVPAELRAGQVSFHHCKTIHGSAANVSDRPRVGIAVHLMSGDARCVRDRFHPNQELFEGQDGDLWRGPRFPRLWPPAD